MAGRKGITSFNNMSLLMKTNHTALQDGKSPMLSPFPLWLRVKVPFGWRGVGYCFCNIRHSAIGWGHQKHLMLFAKPCLPESHSMTRFFRTTRISCLGPLIPLVLVGKSQLQDLRVRSRKSHVMIAKQDKINMKRIKLAFLRSNSHKTIFLTHLKKIGH